MTIKYEIRLGDSLAIMKKMPANSIDLVFTSPPYANLRGYSSIHPDDYVKWFLPFAKQIHRVLQPSGSFVLNINDCVHEGERSLYVFELLIALVRRTGFHYVHKFIYEKKRLMPRGNPKHPSDLFEFVFWLGKSKDPYFDMEPVRVPYSGSPRDWQKEKERGVHHTHSSFDGNGVTNKAAFYDKGGANPGNVIYCHQNFGNEKERHIKHSARMPLRLAEFFLKSMVPDEGVVLDPFMGSGTTLVEAKRQGKQAIGIEIHRDYCNIALERLNNTKTLLEHDPESVPVWEV